MLKRFLNFVELRTKITSVFAFLMALAYLSYKKQPVNWTLTLLFFGSMLLFDLTATAINNYEGAKTAGELLPFRRSTAKATIFLLLLVSTALGLALAFLTDAVVLLLGGLCFLFGVLYSWGPIPLSRQPLGELFSGVFYGLFIPFLLLYINMPAGTFLTFAFDFQTLHLDLNLFPLFSLALLSVTPACATANIMLANNLCDLEKDIGAKRYTLPYYLGEKALSVFAGLYSVSYVSVVGMVFLKILPSVCLLSLLTIVPIRNNVNRFKKKQQKEETFVLSVQNYVILVGTNSLLIFIGGFFN
ncbi:UbiA family prenyltransferase [Caproiciproducens sp. CPB-2]|uniref:UbiA family prenyltransferase n=1 Tax=Caproiciproducens sp. CPB-2 TaxID=3030017 RepID=UPI0023DB7764|nr:UbiA family prenyltransferase [Caproiciproducens sp. CPB-2]MDF1493875.1 UbiA family prenyltransferase [Caproiciproducens sp. CPB-2]